MNIFKVLICVSLLPKKANNKQTTKKKQKQTNLEYYKCFTFLCHKKNKKSEKVSSQVDSSILKSLTLHLCRLYMNLTLVKFNLNLVKLNLNLTLKLDFILYNLYLFARRFLGGSGVSDTTAFSGVS